MQKLVMSLWRVFACTITIIFSEGIAESTLVVSCVIMCGALPYRSYSRLFSSSRVLSYHGHVYSNMTFFRGTAWLHNRDKKCEYAPVVSCARWWVALLAAGSNTLVCATGAFGAMSVLEQAFPHLATGAITMPVKTAGELLLFALSTIVLPAIVEETIFRKRMICLANRTAIICTTLLSAMLFAAEHFVAPWGVLLGMVWALPLCTNDDTYHCEHTHLGRRW